MNWDEVMIDDWIVTTAELRRHKGLDKIMITTRHRDVRKRIESYYDDYRYGLSLILARMQISTNLFLKKCRGESLFNETEKEILIQMLHLSEEEQKIYLE